MTDPRSRAALLAVLLGALAVPAAADLAEVKARGTLRVIAAREEAPEMFNFNAGGEPGFEREIVEGFARLHGLKVQAVAAPTTADRIPLLQKGEGDMIIGIISTEERRKVVAFTHEVLPARHIVVNYAPAPAVATVEQFRKEKIGLVTGTSWEKAALEEGVAAGSAQGFSDRYKALDALKAGTITATVMSVSDFTLAAKHDPKLRGGVFVGAASSAGFALRKSDTALLKEIDLYLDNMRKGPSWSRLVVKYFGEQALSVLGRAQK